MSGLWFFLVRRLRFVREVEAAAVVLGGRVVVKDLGGWLDYTYWYTVDRKEV